MNPFRPNVYPPETLSCRIPDKSLTNERPRVYNAFDVDLVHSRDVELCSESMSTVFPPRRPRRYPLKDLRLGVQITRSSDL